MVLREFPDLHWLKKQAEARFAGKKAWNGQTLPQNGWPTVVLNVETKGVFRDNIRGPLSIFSNLSGESLVTADRRTIRIREGFFFVTNHDQYYTLSVERQPALTANIHFSEYLVDEVFQSLSDSPEKLLENKFFPPLVRREFYNKLYHKDENTSRLIRELCNTSHDELLRQEKLFELLAHLIREDKQIQRTAAELPVIKNATRQELMKRLLCSADYIHDSLNRNLSLEELAHSACLSKFHFLRLFKVTFGKTPHQFLNHVRVQKGKEMLLHSKTDVRDIAHELGFAHASAFSRVFFSQVGVYPSQFRR
ncbi:MAG: helix-turn-helix domain-containing protein [Bacteroidota bacterium]